jgi:hypothetical protein
MIITYLISQLSNDITLSINLILHFAFLQITEFLRDKRILITNSAKYSVSITLGLVLQRIRLLTNSELISCLTGCKLRLQCVCLISNSQTILAAALTDLTCN